MRHRPSLAWVLFCVCLACSMPGNAVAGVVAPPPDDAPIVDPVSDCDDPAAPYECADEVPDDIIVNEPTNAPECDGLDDPFVCSEQADDETMAGDRDQDGLDDATEEMIGTDPDKHDTDGDGLGDGVEYIFPPGVDDGCALQYDCDGDGLSDGEEAVLGTSYIEPDTDGDNVSDGQEVREGKNPLDPTDNPTRKRHRQVQTRPPPRLLTPGSTASPPTSKWTARRRTRSSA